MEKLLIRQMTGAISAQITIKSNQKLIDVVDVLFRQPMNHQFVESFFWCESWRGTFWNTQLYIELCQTILSCYDDNRSGDVQRRCTKAADKKITYRSTRYRMYQNMSEGYLPGLHVRVWKTLMSWKRSQLGTQTKHPCLCCSVPPVRPRAVQRKSLLPSLLVWSYTTIAVQVSNIKTWHEMTL